MVGLNEFRLKEKVIVVQYEYLGLNFWIKFLMIVKEPFLNDLGVKCESLLLVLICALQLESLHCALQRVGESPLCALQRVCESQLLFLLCALQRVCESPLCALQLECESQLWTTILLLLLNFNFHFESSSHLFFAFIYLLIPILNIFIFHITIIFTFSLQ